MKNINLIQYLNNLYKPPANVLLVLDLGSKWIKGLFLKNDQPEQLFIFSRQEDEIKQIADYSISNFGCIPPAVLLLSGKDTIIRYISFPKVPKEELKEAIEYQLGEYLPFASGEVYFDFFVLKENSSSQDYFLVLAAAKRPLVDSILDKCAKYELNLQAISLTNIGLINFYFSSERLDVNTAIIDLGVSKTSLNLIKKDMPFLSRDILLTIPENSPTAGLDNFFHELDNEIRSCFDYFEINCGEEVQKLLLCGAGSLKKEIVQHIKETIDLPVMIWNPENILDKKVKVPSLELMPLFCGLLGE